MCVERRESSGKIFNRQWISIQGDELEYLACRNLARWIWATSAAKVLAVWKALLLWWRCFRPCLSRVLLFLFTLGIVLNRIALGEEERFGLRGSADLSLANTGIPYVNAQSPGTETDLSGQFILLGSARICTFLAFYEGRLQHFEGISGSDPRHQSTHGQPLLQGYLRYTPRASWKLSIQAGRFGTPFGQFLQP